MILKGITNFRRLCKVAAGFVTVSCSSYAIAPILSIISQWRHEKRPIRYNLIYPTAYPWEHPASGFLYNCHFLNEYLTTFSIITVTASIDSVFVYYVFQIIGMIREISHHMSRFDQGNADAIIRQCVQQYEVLLECRRKVEKIFGPIILWSMGTNAIILCAVIFQLSHVRNLKYLFIFFLILNLGLMINTNDVH